MKQPTDVTTHDVACRTSLEFQCSPNSTLFHLLVNKRLETENITQESFVLNEKIKECEDALFVTAVDILCSNNFNDKHTICLSHFTVSKCID
jgi:recombinational DNA repair protein RecR